MVTELVHVARRGPVATLTLDSPHNRNALSSRLLEELSAALSAEGADDAVRVVVLTATGSVFCSGADLAERPVDAPARLREIMAALRTTPKPVVARVGGHARAGGLGLIAACDLAAATARCTFAFSEVRVGVAPAMIMVPALGVVDRRFLAAAVLTGEPFAAAEAAGAGLLTGVVDDEGALDQWVARTSASLLKAAPGALAATKALLAALPDATWAEGLTLAEARTAALFEGAEAAEGIEAFLAKRAPSWDVTAP